MRRRKEEGPFVAYRVSQADKRCCRPSHLFFHVQFPISSSSTIRQPPSIFLFAGMKTTLSPSFIIARRRKWCNLGAFCPLFPFPALVAVRSVRGIYFILGSVSSRGLSEKTGRDDPDPPWPWHTRRPEKKESKVCGAESRVGVVKIGKQSRWMQRYAAVV